MPIIRDNKYEGIYQAFAKVLKEYEDELTPLEMLAVASNLVGKLMAMQDQREMTPESVITVVQKNIELGNQQVITELLGHTIGSG